MGYLFYRGEEGGERERKRDMVGKGDLDILSRGPEFLVTTLTDRRMDARTHGRQHIHCVSEKKQDTKLLLITSPNVN